MKKPRGRRGVREGTLGFWGLPPKRGEPGTAGLGSEQAERHERQRDPGCEHQPAWAWSGMFSTGMVSLSCLQNVFLVLGLR